MGVFDGRGVFPRPYLCYSRPMRKYLLPIGIAIVLYLGIHAGLSAVTTSMVVGSQASGFTVTGSPAVGMDYASYESMNKFNSSTIQVELMRGSNAAGWSTVGNWTNSVVPTDSAFRAAFPIDQPGQYRVAFLRGSSLLASKVFQVQ